MTAYNHCVLETRLLAIVALTGCKTIMDPLFKKFDQISNLHQRTVIIKVYRSNPVF